MTLPPQLAGRLIVCMGIPRSGSTWAFNMVCGILREAAPSLRVASCFADDWDAISWRSTRDVLVLKIHDPQGASLPFYEFLQPPVIVSVRDPRDCIASMVGWRGRTPELEQHFRQSCAAAIRLAKIPGACVIKYEDGAIKNIATVRRIAERLGLSLWEGQATALMDELSAESVQRKITASGEQNTELYDPVTLFHPGHVGNGLSKSRALPEDEIASINRWARDYCEAFGYDLPGAKPIAPGRTVLRFRHGSPALPYLLTGFSLPEPGYVWTDGTSATITIPLTEPVGCRLECSFDYFTPNVDPAPKVIISLMANDSTVDVRKRFVGTSLDGLRELNFRIAIENPCCPVELGGSTDDRRLGMALQSITIEY
jgi:hypothetical protein